MKYIIFLCLILLTVSCSRTSLNQRELQFGGTINNVTKMDFNSIDLMNIKSIGELLPFEYVRLNMDFERGSLMLDFGIMISLNYIGSKTSPILGKFDYDIFIEDELLRKGEYKNAFDFLKHNNSIMLEIKDKFELPEYFYEETLAETIGRFIKLPSRNKFPILLKLYNFHSLLDSTIIGDTLFINSDIEKYNE